MKMYSLSFTESINYQHPAPERTAYRNGVGMNFDRLFQVWPNRESMARSIRMQQRRESHSNDWKAVVALKGGEGY